MKQNCVNFTTHISTIIYCVKSRESRDKTNNTSKSLSSEFRRKMSLLCVALVGKWNEPLYFFCKEEASEYLHLQMIAHSALDVIEERKKRALASTTSFDMYFGQLFPIEDYRVYGNYSNTHHKIVIICDSAGAENVGIRETINSLSVAFVNAAQNPFQEVGKPLRSKKLEAAVNQVVNNHNNMILKKRL